MTWNSNFHKNNWSELEYFYDNYQLNEEEKMSKLFSLNLKDLLNGLLFAVIGNVVMYLLVIFSSLYQLVMTGDKFTINIDFKAIIVVAVFSALTYLSKRFVSNENGNVLQK